MSYYNQGPPGPPYPPSNSPYPPQGGYPPPQQGYSQQPPLMNQGYQQQWGSQPQQGYGGSPYPPSHSPYNAPPGPPPGQWNQAPAPQWNQGPPPPGQYGPPPGPPPQFGAPPPMNYGAGPPTPPSLGYVPGQQSNQNMSRAANDLRSAMKGFGTNEQALINVLAKLDPLAVNSVKAAYRAQHHRDLLDDVRGETSGYFRELLEAIIRGPLEQDCHVLHHAIKGAGTKESALNDVLLGRSNADMNAIKQFYHHKYKRSLESDVKGDLSLKTERLFEMIMSARRNEESAPVIQQQIDQDAQEIYRATEGRAGADQLVVCQIMSQRSNGQIRAIGAAYQQRYHRTLQQVFAKEFSGHMKDALVYMAGAGEDPAKNDADMLEDAMKGAGTKDQALVRRIVAIHWDPQRLQQAKGAYKHYYKRELRQRIEGETSGDYKKLAAIVG